MSPQFERALRGRRARAASRDSASEPYRANKLRAEAAIPAVLNVAASAFALLAGAALVSSTSFIVQAQPLESSDTRAAIVYGAASVLSGAFVTLTARVHSPSITWLRRLEIALGSALALYALAVAYLFAGFSVHRAGGTPLITFLWLLLGHLVPLVTPALLIVDRRRVRRAQARGRRPWLVSYTLLWGIAFCASVWPWLYYG